MLSILIISLRFKIHQVSNGLFQISNISSRDLRKALFIKEILMDLRKVLYTREIQSRHIKL
uniref:Uncharacterized protein n=1 Tax=Magallana gigas TaxID=29159 RepID=K1QAC8_MAGGI